MAVSGEGQLTYGAWITRERRVGAKILGQSPEMRQNGLCRVCAGCCEACLCHETACPNCGGEEIGLRRVDQRTLAGNEPIRCCLPYERPRAQDRG